MKKLFALTALVVTLFTACKKDNETPSTKMVKTNVAISGMQENPAVTTAASGTMDYDYDQATKMFHYTIRWNGLSGAPTGMHIHGPAARGVNSGVLAGISGFTAAATGTFTGMVVVDNVTLKEADLLAGKWYVNIHTTANAGGEIRGQIEF
jgi:Cu/Zn superoxide dismutase